MHRSLVSLRRGALVALAFALSSVAALAAAPFKGFFRTHHADEFIVGEVAPGVYAPVGVNVDVAGAGPVTFLGATICFSNDQTGSFLTGAVTATYTLRSIHHDDTVVLRLDAMQTVFDPVARHVELAGTFTIVCGTGRFAAATGSGTCSAKADFDFELGGPTNSGPGSWEFCGTIDLGRGSCR